MATLSTVAPILPVRDAGAGGHLGAPEDTPWGMREGVHIDPEGNAIRFGHRLDGP
jgi:hypothetical protein